MLKQRKTLSTNTFKGRKYEPKKIKMENLIDGDFDKTLSNGSDSEADNDGNDETESDDDNDESK